MITRVFPHELWTVPATVTDVIDGDTLVLDLDLGWDIWLRSTKVRLAHIDAPELHIDGKENQPGIDARDYMNTLVSGASSNVMFRSGTKDKYGRLLGDVFQLHDRGPGKATAWAAGPSFSDQMLTAGHAVPYSGGKRG